MTNRLDILITADNKQARQAFKQTEGDLDSLETKTQSAGRGFNAMTVALGAAAAGALAFKGGQLALELAKGADQALRVEQAYKNLAKTANISADSMLQASRKMSQGSINDTNLMLAANKAMLLNVVDSTEQFVGLMEVAIERGAAAGISSTESLERIITGIGRGSIQILDDLGIKGLQEKMAAYAVSIGKTVNELTDLEKTQALTNQILLEADGILNTNVGSFDGYAAAIDNLKDALGELFLPTIGEGATVLAQGINDFLDALERVQAGETNWGAEIGNRLVNPETAQIIQDYEELTVSLENLQKMLTFAETEFTRASGAGEWDIVGDQAQRIHELQLSINSTTTALEELSKASGGVLPSVAEQFADVAREAELAQAPLLSMGELFLNIPKKSGIDASEVLGITNIEEHSKIAANAAKELRQQLTALHKEADQAALTLAEDAFGAGGAEAAKSAFEGLRGELRSQVDAWLEAGHPIELITGVLLPQYVAGIQEAGSTTVAEIGNATGAMLQFQGAVGATIAQLDAWRSRTTSMLQGMSSRLVGDLGAEGAIEFFEDSTAAVEEQRKAWFLAGHDIEYIDNILLPSYVSSLDDAYTKTTQISSATGGLVDSYDSLTSKIQSILQGATGPVAGVNAEDFLPREDEINENARRLADIMVNGFTGQDWVGEFAAEVPDIFEALTASSDPQGTAARLLKDFQDGLRPELLDKEKAKEIVRRALLGEARTAAFAKEIAAEMGAGLDEVRDALGLDTENEMELNVIIPSKPTSTWTWPRDPMKSWKWPKAPGWVGDLIGALSPPSDNGGDAGGGDVGANALGTSFWRGGLTWVGERGPEIVNLPRGSQVYSNEQSRMMAPSININNPTIASNVDVEVLAIRVAQHIQRAGVMA